MKKIFLFFLLFLLFPCSTQAKIGFCYKDSELADNMTPYFYADDALYHHASQGMCIAGKYIIFTRYNSDSSPTTYMLIDIETKKEVAHYEFNTQHSNSLTYNPDTKEVVAVSNGHAFVMELDGDELIFKEDILLSHNCPKIAYVKSKHAYYLGTGSAVYRSENLTSMEKVFSVSERATNQGMGTDGKYLYIIWYRVGKNDLDVYSLDGKLVRTMTLTSNSLREIEDLDFYKKTMYINIENSGYNDGIYTVSQQHDFSKWQIDLKPTCAKKGAKHRTCQLCAINEDAEIPATGKHKAGKWIQTKDPTCEEEGEHIKKCKVCKKVLKKEALPALGHVYSSWEVTREPTVLEEGEQEKVCSRCNKVIKSSVAKLPATIKINVTELPLQKKHSTNGVKVKLNTGDYIDYWSSDNPEIAQVSSDGEITGLKRGEAYITAVSKGGAKASVHIKVQWLPVFTKEIKVDKKKICLTVGGIYDIPAHKIPFTSWNKIRYKSKNKSVATVTKDGEIVGKGKGKTTIKISSWMAKEEVVVTVQ